MTLSSPQVPPCGVRPRVPAGRLAPAVARRAGAKPAASGGARPHGRRRGRWRQAHVHEVGLGGTPRGARHRASAPSRSAADASDRARRRRQAHSQVAQRSRSAAEDRAARARRPRRRRREEAAVAVRASGARWPIATQSAGAAGAAAAMWPAHGAPWFIDRCPGRRARQACPRAHRASTERRMRSPFRLTRRRHGATPLPTSALVIDRPPARRAALCRLANGGRGWPVGHVHAAHATSARGTRVGEAADVVTMLPAARRHVAQPRRRLGDGSPLSPCGFGRSAPAGREVAAAHVVGAAAAEAGCAMPRSRRAHPARANASVAQQVVRQMRRPRRRSASRAPGRCPASSPPPGRRGTAEVVVGPHVHHDGGGGDVASDVFDRRGVAGPGVWT